MTVPRSLLKVAAALFLLVMAAYSAGLIYYNMHRFPSITLGETSVYLNNERAMREPQRSATEASRHGDVLRISLCL